MQHTEWKDFIPGVWSKAIDVRDFIQRNYKPYEGDGSFLVGPTERTEKLWNQVLKLYEEEREKGGMIDADTSVATHITAHKPGYIDKDLETIVGLQTDKPLKRALFPYGGLRTAKSAAADFFIASITKSAHSFKPGWRDNLQIKFSASNFSPSSKRWATKATSSFSESRSLVGTASIAISVKL